MKFAFVNPNWSFTGSTYFGCRDPHYPLELLFAAQKIELRDITLCSLTRKTKMSDWKWSANWSLHLIPISSWSPPRPRIYFGAVLRRSCAFPMECFRTLQTRALKVCIGPHASATPTTVLHKTGADIAIKGEPEEAILDLASRPWESDRRYLLSQTRWRVPYQSNAGNGRHEDFGRS